MHGGGVTYFAYSPFKYCFNYFKIGGIHDVTAISPLTKETLNYIFLNNYLQNVISLFPFSGGRAFTFSFLFLFPSQRILIVLLGFSSFSSQFTFCAFRSFCLFPFPFPAFFCFLFSFSCFLVSFFPFPAFFCFLFSFPCFLLFPFSFPAFYRYLSVIKRKLFLT